MNTYFIYDLRPVAFHYLISDEGFLIISNI